MIAAHELAHGLGFKSALVPQSVSGGKLLVSPKIFSSGNTAYFEPLSAFDSLVYHFDSPMVQIADALTTFEKSNTTISPSQYMEWIAFTKNNLEILTELYSMTADGNLMLHLRSQDLWLQRVNVFDDNEILLHASNSAKYIKEFVVAEETNFKGKVLGTEMLKREMKGVFGPLTMEVMEAIGYLTSSTNSAPKFDILHTFGTRKYSPLDAKYVPLLEVDWEPIEFSPKAPPEVINILDDDDEDDLNQFTINDDVADPLPGNQLIDTFGYNVATSSPKKPHRNPLVSDNSLNSMLALHHAQNPPTQPPLNLPIFPRPNKKQRNNE